MSLKNFVQNLRYLFRYNLKGLYNNLKDIDETYITRYELINHFMPYRKPKIKNNAETINDIISHRASICRFGDGEFELIQNNSIPFQEADNKLAERLTQVLKSNESNCFIGINQFWERNENSLDYVENFGKIYVSKKLKFLDKLIDRNKQYYLSSFNQVYILFNANYDFETYFCQLREIWKNRDITVICGEGIFSTHQYNVFDCAKSIEYLNAPRKNAFNDYQEILKRAKKISKNRLVLIILGPTATVLAFDLHNLGYQAIDIGHCAKDYNAYKTKLEKNHKNCCEFFQPD